MNPKSTYTLIRTPPSCRSISQRNSRFPNHRRALWTMTMSLRTSMTEMRRPVPSKSATVAFSMPGRQNPQQNHLLAALSAAEQRRL
jgi:hypothetical protein